MREYFIDTRELEHPVPLEMAIDTLKKLDESSYMYMLHRKEPIPLLALASEHNLNFISKLEQDNNWHILITPNSSAELNNFIKLEDSRVSK